MTVLAPDFKGKYFSPNAAATGLLCLCLMLTDFVSASIRLQDVTKQTGISFVHTDGSSGKRYIVETVSAGLALFDYDGDGDINLIDADSDGDALPDGWEIKGFDVDNDGDLDELRVPGSHKKAEAGQKDLFLMSLSSM